MFHTNKMITFVAIQADKVFRELVASDKHVRQLRKAMDELLDKVQTFEQTHVNPNELLNPIEGHMADLTAEIEKLEVILLIAWRC